MKLGCRISEVSMDEILSGLCLRASEVGVALEAICRRLATLRMWQMLGMLR